jgi:hypothetical protein
VKLRPIGTCEHIWSPWLSVTTMVRERRHLLGLLDDRTHWRCCDLCWGYQYAQSDAWMREMERAAMDADLTGARRSV